MKYPSRSGSSDPDWGLLLQPENFILGAMLLIMTATISLRPWLF